MLEKNDVLNNLQLKTRKVTFEVFIDANATPASKKITTDLPGVAVVATEGLLTPVTDVEAVSGLTNYTAPNDANGICIVMLKGSALGSVRKVQNIEVLEKVSAGWASVTLQALGTSQGLTSGGNIAFEIDTTTDFSSADGKFMCEVTYLLAE
jgi:hypothetical protein